MRGAGHERGGRTDQKDRRCHTQPREPVGGGQGHQRGGESREQQQRPFGAQRDLGRRGRRRGERGRRRGRRHLRYAAVLPQGLDADTRLEAADRQARAISAEPRFRQVDRVECARRAKGGTGGLQAIQQAMRAERALGHGTAGRVEDRRVVRASPGAVVAAHALALIEQKGAAGRIAGVSQRRAGVHACGLSTVIAGEGKVIERCRRMPPGVEGLNAAPAQLRFQLVLDGAGQPASVAAGAAIDVEDEASRHRPALALRRELRERPRRNPCRSRGRRSRSSRCPPH